MKTYETRRFTSPKRKRKIAVNRSNLSAKNVESHQSWWQLKKIKEDGMQTTRLLSKI